MPRPHLTLFVDVVSPFAYMAFYMTRNSPIFKQCDIEYIPIFLGGVMQACGNTPPIRIKNKDKYIALDRDRSAKLFSITEAGWPVGGPTEGQAVASTENTKTYWDSVGCDIFNQYNVWWYILRDNNADPTPDPTFGIVGRELEDPLFDLTCPQGSNGAQQSASPSSSSSATNDSAIGIISNATSGFNNATIDGVDISEALNLTDIANATATDAAVHIDIASIMKNLPDIMAANPQLISRLPDLIAENSELVERLLEINSREGYVTNIPNLDLPPVYVAVIANAIRHSEHRAVLDRLASDAGFANGTEGVIDTLGGSGDGGVEGLLDVLGQAKDADGE